MNLRKSLLWTLAATTLATTLGLSPGEAQQQIPDCQVEIEPNPNVNPSQSGVNHTLGHSFADTMVFGPNAAKSNDYHWMHSSVHLQGAPALQKWGACVFFNPDKEHTGNIDMSDWRSAVVVNNPSPNSITATITYRDPEGNILNSFQKPLGPEETFVKGAIELRWYGKGIGSVEVTADGPIVGATLHRFSKLTLSNGQLVTDPDHYPELQIPTPGANSMQQLQMSQDSAKSLYSGPFPIASTSRQDFLNGVLPLNCVLNPNPANAKITVSSMVAPGTPLSTQTFTLKPFGMHLDTSLWSFAEPLYLSQTGGLNLDVISTVTSHDGPILGDFLMVDVFGNGAASTLTPGARFRMGSGMMQNSPASLLVNPEHVETGPFALPLPPPTPPIPATPPVSTMMGIANVSGSDIGPVNVKIFNSKGEKVAHLTFPSLPPGATRRITPATSAIPQNFAGWALITACEPGLIGWTMREVWQQLVPLPSGEQVKHFRKVFGEELDGANGAEPGTGFSVTTGGQTWLRKVAPLLRAGRGNTPPWWPSYVNTVNADYFNIGSYRYQFFDLPGALSWQQAFNGLQLWKSSFTYVEPIVNPNFYVNVSGRFDDRPTGHQSGHVRGMEAIGDPLQEWNIPFFLGSEGNLPSPPDPPAPQ